MSQVDTSGADGFTFSPTSDTRLHQEAPICDSIRSQVEKVNLRPYAKGQLIRVFCLFACPTCAHLKADLWMSKEFGCDYVAHGNVGFKPLTAAH